MDIREPALGIVFEPKEVSKGSARATAEAVAVVWGANWVAKVDLERVKSGSSAPQQKKQPARREADRKRARDEEGADLASTANQLDIKITRKYQPLVLFDFVGQGELVAVERTWFDLSKGMVDAFVKSGEFAT